MRNYELTIQIRDDDHPERMAFIKLENSGKAQTIKYIGSEMELTADEQAMVAIINETVRKVSNGKIVDYTPDLLAFEEVNRVSKCEWLRSGNLKIHGFTDKLYHFVETVEAALAEPRTFTCPFKLVQSLPKVKKHQDKEVKEASNASL